MSDGVVRVAYLPNGSFVLPFRSALQQSKQAPVRALNDAWSASALNELGVSLSTKLTMLGLLAKRLYAPIIPLVAELGTQTDVATYLDGPYGWQPAKPELPYEALLAFDAFIFEFRSAYELLGKFMVTFAEVILKESIAEKDLVDVLAARGLPTEWAAALRIHRIEFFHRRAPWIAFRVRRDPPHDPEVVFLSSPSASLSDPTEAIPLSDIRAIYSGFESALRAIQSWALEQIAGLDALAP